MMTTSRQRAARAPVPAYTTAFVDSRDGAKVGYRRLGQGPGLVVLHGTMESALSHLQLAQALADRFTVYLPDRRGRGIGAAYGAEPGIHTELDDLEALLTQTGARNVFGVSVGAIVALEATMALPVVDNVALFEPPLIIDGSISTSFMERFDREMDEGDTAAALVTAMLGSEMGPPIFNSVPRPALKLLTRLGMASEDRKNSAEKVTMRMLAATLHNDFNLSVESQGVLARTRSVSAQLLLLGASKSPTYFKVAVDALARALPGARRIQFGGVNHGASGNSNRGGKPSVVADTLARFFGGSA
jgi:pimeloyl-ACP methyl ester carboxylesterase